MADSKRELYDLAQRRLVASLLSDGESAKRAFELVSSEDVEEPSLNLIIEAIANISRRDETVSAVSVARELESAGKLQAVGGIAELYNLEKQGETFLLESPIELYASIVRDSSIRKQLREALTSAKSDFFDDSGMSINESIANIQSIFTSALYKMSDDVKTTEVGNFKEEYLQILEDRRKTAEENAGQADGLQGIPSLLPTLNKYTSGWNPQQIITIGARTGIGKSVFAVNSAVAAARAGKSVLFFSLEMSNQEIVDRIIACMSGVTLNNLREGKLSESDYQHVNAAFADLKNMKLMIDTEEKLTVDGIRARAIRRAQSECGLDMIIVDYLQLITPVSRFSSRREAVDDISRNMKLLAKSLNVPIMVLVQLNRASKDEDEDKIPTKDNIRESGAIAQDSDIVILLHRESSVDNTTPNTLVILDKNRSGESQKIIRCSSNLACSVFLETNNEKKATETLSDEDLKNLEDEVDLSDFDDDFDDDFGSELENL